MMTKDIENVLMRGSIADLRTLYLEKKLSVTDAVNWYLNRINNISQHGPAINAVREVSLRAVDDAKRADEAIARGDDLQVLHGIPFLLKDNILTGDGMKAAAGAAAIGASTPLLAIGAVLLSLVALFLGAAYGVNLIGKGFLNAGQGVSLFGDGLLKAVSALVTYSKEVSTFI